MRGVELGAQIVDQPVGGECRIGRHHQAGTAGTGGEGEGRRKRGGPQPNSQFQHQLIVAESPQWRSPRMARPFAEFERALILERQRAGIAAAKQRGV